MYARQREKKKETILPKNYKKKKKNFDEWIKEKWFFKLKGKKNKIKYGNNGVSSLLVLKKLSH